MKIRIRLCCLAPPLLVLTLASIPSGNAAAAEHERCSALTPATLPHTADAIEGWVRNCDRDRGRALPRTADGATGWVENEAPS